MGAWTDPDGKSERRILIDMSHAFNSGLNTGIQRVIRKLAEHLPQVAEPAGIVCVAVVFRDGCFQAVESQSGSLAWDYASFKRSFSDRLPQWYRRTLAGLNRYKPLSKLHSLLVPASGRLGAFSLPAKLFFLAHRGLRRLSRHQRRIGFTDRDVLLMPDGYWVLPEIWTGVASAKREGAQVAVVVYDLICIQHPELFVDGAEGKFRDYIERVFDHADRVIAISKTVESDLRALRPAPAGSRPALSSFCLGADISKKEGTVRSRIKEILAASGRPTYLIVSTLEPRKNHLLALDAFDRVWETCNANLVIAGRLGWKYERIVDRIQTHPKYNDSLFLVTDASDAELSYCYQHAHGVLCPSLAEGFGLPIVEALWHGKTTFVSDIPIHREVGGEQVLYFDKADPEQLASLVSEHLNGNIVAQPAFPQGVISWHESAQQLFDRLTAGLELQAASRVSPEPDCK